MLFRQRRVSQKTKNLSSPGYLRKTLRDHQYQESPFTAEDLVLDLEKILTSSAGIQTARDPTLNQQVPRRIVMGVSGRVLQRLLLFIKNAYQSMKLYQLIHP